VTKDLADLWAAYLTAKARQAIQEDDGMTNEETVSDVGSLDA
jgi:hypothetical protein